MRYYSDWRECHIASMEQLYDTWRGWAQVCELIDGVYHERKVLSRQEAIDWMNPDRKRYSLRLKHIRSGYGAEVSQGRA